MGKITVEVKINTFGTMKHPRGRGALVDKKEGLLGGLDGGGGLSGGGGSISL